MNKNLSIVLVGVITFVIVCLSGALTSLIIEQPASYVFSALIGVMLGYIYSSWAICEWRTNE